MNKNDVTFSISEVSDMTGVSQNRIRLWYDRGVLPKADTISMGRLRHRRFTHTDIAMIKTINQLRLDGFELSAAVKKAQDLQKK